MGRPTSPGMSLMIFVAWVVNRRTLRSLSKNNVAMSVLLSRFFMSLLDRDKLVHLGLQLGVDGLEFLVQRLHLLLGGGEFLVGGLQFFVGGLHFFVGGPEFLLRGLHLFAGGLQLQADLLEFPFQFRQPGIVGRSFPMLPDPPGAFVSCGAATSVKTIITKPCNGSGSSSRWTVRFTNCSPPLVSMRESA